MKPTTIYPIAGTQWGTTCAQIKSSEKEDLAILAIAKNSTCAGVFTQNAFCAAPVLVARKHLMQTASKYLVINSGNANAGTGEQGLRDANTCCQLIAEQQSCLPEEILPFSTGVIGQYLPMDKVQAAIPNALNDLSSEHWEKAAHAIMTTDTVPKFVSRQVTLQGQMVTITGIAKGAGMIKPNMATLLAFIATDVKIPQPTLKLCLQSAVDQSFNRITVDSDTSTNDSCILAATGQGELHINGIDHPVFPEFSQAITEVCLELAHMLIRDAEGATKFMTISVEEGTTEKECLEVAYTVAHSPLVKTAFYASDANWGRILAAIGRAEINNLVIDKIKIYLEDVCIVENGGVAKAYTDAQGQAVMAHKDIKVRIILGRGNQQATVWTSDLSHEYVKINAEYRT